MYFVLDDEKINEMRNNAIQKYKENIEKRCKAKEIKENMFLESLKEVSELFVESIIEKALKELEYCSENGLLKKRFYFDHFKNKRNMVKVSTLVKGFKINDEWNYDIFKKIGYTSTPFQYAVELLKEKKILLEDVSDIKKGLSFWLQVSILPNE
jgi:hypothetical protein